ncbi:MAG: Nudix family hydrolase [Halofilum sp. (in: g-proteobacteria)]
MAPIAVAVGVLQRADGRVLVAHRGAARHQGGGLEFPGGKIEPGEAAEQALARELFEEIGVHSPRTEPLVRRLHDYGDRTVELDVFLVHSWTGEPCGAEGQRLEWLELEALTPDRFPAANRPILAALRLPPFYLITPAPADGSARERQRIVAGVRRAVERGITMVQLRAHGLDTPAWHALVAEIAAVTDSAGCRLLVNAPVAAVPDLPSSAGLHLSAYEARSLRHRPVNTERTFACSCHGTEEITVAEALEADFAVLGPVLPTPTHPDAPGMGWEAFARHAATTTLPLYALGGVGSAELARVRDAGGIGVAGIRAFWPGD